MTRLRTRLAAAAVGALLVAPLAGCSLLGSTLAEQAPADDVFSIVVGDCLNDAAVEGDVVSTVPIVACTESHDSEVYASHDLDGVEFPGDAALDAALAEFCQGEAFEDFVGIPWLESELETSGFYPTESSWANGDRELLCVIRDSAGPSTGSLENAER